MPIFKPVFGETSLDIQVFNHVMPPFRSPMAGAWPQGHLGHTAAFEGGEFVSFLSLLPWPHKPFPPVQVKSTLLESLSPHKLQYLQSPLNYLGTTLKANEIESIQQALQRSTFRLRPGSTRSSLVRWGKQWFLNSTSHWKAFSLLHVCRRAHSPLLSCWMKTPI